MDPSLFPWVLSKLLKLQEYDFSTDRCAPHISIFYDCWFSLAIFALLFKFSSFLWKSEELYILEARLYLFCKPDLLTGHCSERHEIPPTCTQANGKEDKSKGFLSIGLSNRMSRENKTLDSYPASYCSTMACPSFNTHGRNLEAFLT